MLENKLIDRTQFADIIAPISVNNDFSTASLMRDAG